MSGHNGDRRDRTSGAGGSARPVVLITGCSSGIGAEAARHFARAGFRVFASMRRLDAGEDLRREAATHAWHLTTLPLDVTSDDSVAAAVAALLAETGGRIDVVVNNAGYYCMGAIEETSVAELGAQMETNVLGVLRVIRAVVPTMRAAGRGTVVNVSSISGLVVLPLVGPYHASKFALEALTEALRYEVSPFGVRVVAVEPGPIASAFHRNEIRARDSGGPDSPYAAMTAAYERESARLRRGHPSDVARVIFRASTASHPRLRWRVGPTSFTGGVLRRLIPDRIYEWAIGWVFHRGWRPGARLAAAPGAKRESAAGRSDPGPV
jgi:NAD(P)-dependent dehydrogenase (short-subunit alcohol dehydrogenase family)